MVGYVIRRLLIMVPVFFGVTAIVFAGICLTPGDPLLAIVPFEQLRTASPEEVQAMRHSLGLDQPIPVRYVKWLRELLSGNFGYSLIRKAPVAELIKERFFNTVRLSGVALVMGFIVGVTAGILMALKQYSWIDYSLSFFVLIQWSTPAFFAGLAAMWLFAVQLQWLPAFGMFTPGQPLSLWDQIRHMIMPATILGLFGSASWARYTRASMLDALHSDYVTTARAKGLRERTVILRHVFRNASLPVLTMLGLSIPYLLNGAVIIETVFAWPGMGRLSVTAALSRDHPLLMGCVSLAAFTVMLSSLLTDIAYAIVDPRIRYD